jgi:ABC-type transport system involved in multi-copper enzyme maturation permease subunit
LHKTFHVLLMTPINAWQIAAGKLFSRLLTAMVLIALSLPVLALVRLLGGVELSDMFGVICLAAVTCLTTAALGLLYSTLLNRTYIVILLAYATLLFFYLFVPFMLQLIIIAASRNTGAPRPWMFLWIKIVCAFNPVACTGMIVSGASRYFATEWYPTVLTHLGITALLVLLTGLLLRRLARREGEGGPAVAAPSAAPMPVASAEPTSLDASAEPVADAPPAPSPSPRRRQTFVWDNPVFWREVRKPLLKQRWQRYTIGGIIFGLLLFTYWGIGAIGELDDRDAHVGYAFVFYTLFMLLLCVLSGTAIAQEKESDTWTVLLTTPTTAHAILLGKIAGIGARLGWPLALITLHFLIFAIGGIVSWTAALLTIFVTISFNSIWLATGLYLSLRVAKVTTAVIINLLLPVLFYGGFSLILVTVEALFPAEARHFSENCTWYLPYFYMAIPISEINEHYYQANEIEMPGTGWHSTPGAFVMTTLIMGLVHLMIAALAIFYTTGRFNRIVGRASQKHDWQPRGFEVQVR